MLHQVKSFPAKDESREVLQQPPQGFIPEVWKRVTQGMVSECYDLEGVIAQEQGRPVDADSLVAIGLHQGYTEALFDLADMIGMEADNAAALVAEYALAQRLWVENGQPNAPAYAAQGTGQGDGKPLAG